MWKARIKNLKHVQSSRFPRMSRKRKKHPPSCPNNSTSFLTHNLTYHFINTHFSFQADPNEGLFHAGSMIGKATLSMFTDDKN